MELMNAQLPNKRAGRTSAGQRNRSGWTDCNGPRLRQTTGRSPARACRARAHSANTASSQGEQDAHCGPVGHIDPVPARPDPKLPKPGRRYTRAGIGGRASAGGTALQRSSSLTARIPSAHAGCVGRRIFPDDKRIKLVPRKGFEPPTHALRILPLPSLPIPCGHTKSSFA